LQKNKAIIIAGPTASGKSGFGLAVAKELDGVIINADSLQIYNGLPTLTAQPSQQERAEIPHRLYGTLAPDDACNAQRWQKLAVQEMGNAAQEKKTPIILGGTGLYIKALVSGFSAIPETDPDIRGHLTQMLASIGNVAFHQKLLAIDPVSAEKIPVGNTQRLIRAMEVFESTGKPLSYWHAQAPVPVQGWHFHAVTLLPQRDVLYSRCDQRFAQMIELGVLEEVKNFENKNPKPCALKSALGYKPLLDYLSGTLTRQEAIKQSQQDTRNYAKRQITWFRHQIKSDITLEKTDAESIRTICQSFQSCV
jgi:tRNA dimethylallyltransferase